LILVFRSTAVLVLSIKIQFYRFYNIIDTLSKLKCSAKY